MEKRLDFEAESLQQVISYYDARARQLLHSGFIWEGIIETIEDWGVKTFFTKGDKRYQSIYIFNQFRGKGLVTKFLNSGNNTNDPFITTTSCDISSFLDKRNVPYVLNDGFLETKEYKVIQNFYSNRKSKRSKVFLMNHIDEGLAVLEKMGIVQDETFLGYILHPLCQEDHYLVHSWDRWDIYYADCDPRAVTLAMEYRNIANQYLSNRKISRLSEIRLSPIGEVNHMLMADKVQNYKDFCLYHKESHQRSKELEQYFLNWFKRLDLTSEEVNDLLHHINRFDLIKVKDVRL